MDVDFEFSVRYLLVIKELKRIALGKPVDRKNLVSQLKTQYQICLNDTDSWDLLVQNLRIITFYASYLFPDEKMSQTNQCAHYKYLTDFFDDCMSQIGNDHSIAKKVFDIYQDVHLVGGLLVQFAFVVNLFNMFDKMSKAQNLIDIIGILKDSALSPTSRYAFYYIYSTRISSSKTKNDIHKTIENDLCKLTSKRVSRNEKGKIIDDIDELNSSLFPTTANVVSVQKKKKFKRK